MPKFNVHYELENGDRNKITIDADSPDDAATAVRKKFGKSTYILKTKVNRNEPA